jgi:aminopeptidase N
MVSNLNAWRRFDPERRERMKAALERIAAKKPLSKDVFEIVTRALASSSTETQ